MHSRETIETWIVQYLARQLDLPGAQVNAQDAFDRLGIDSVAAVELMADLEAWLGTGELDPTLPYDHKTIAALAGHLAELGARRAG
jgi:acyl carrier protein